MPAPSASPTTGRYTHLSVVALTVLVFGTVVAAVTLQLRAGLREQILRSEAERLAAVAAMQLDNSASDMGEERIAQVPGTLLVAVVKTARLRGVLGVRVFGADRGHNSSDGIIGEPEPPTERDWARVTKGEAFARLQRPVVGGESSFIEPVPAGARLVEAWVPLRRTGAPTVLGAAQFWLADSEASADLSAHDRRLWTQAAIAWAGGSIVIVAALGWAFRRLNAANVQLRARTEDLQRANRELVLAAKTSALGTVTAHLMHELKNPLAGLETIVAGQSDASARGEGGGELAAASALTRRLRRMVNDVVGVLRDEQSSAEFELTAADVVEIVHEKIRAEASMRGITLQVEALSEIALPGRRANLAVLVLRNLLQNALEATPAGGAVKLVGRNASDGAVEFLVEDTGGGLPETVRARLFQPCASTKPEGTGVGLALSAQIAQQAGGRLELVRTDERGTSFRLVLAVEP